MAMRSVSCALAALVPAALLCAAIWRAAEPSLHGRAAGSLLGRSLRASGPVPHLTYVTCEWRQIGPGQPVFGSGSGDCTGCHSPIQTAASLDLTLEDCQKWLEHGCPDTPDRPKGCPNANALAYRAGWWHGDTHTCRAWTCDNEPGWNWDAQWDCLLHTGGRETTTTAPAATSRSSTSSPEPPKPTTSTTIAVSTAAAATTPMPTSAPILPTTTPAPTQPTTTSAQAATSAPPTTAPPAPPTLPPGPQCSEHPVKSYILDWRAQGHSFFNDWTFMLSDYNNGAVEYLDRQAAEEDKVVQAFDTHAILRTGSRGSRLKRHSAKIQSNRAWKYFLMTMKFSHTPWGCGLWPAFWTHAPGFPWPEGGELDILEYVNDLPSQTSFHTGEANSCRLDGGQINRPSCPIMPDLNGMNYDCTTKYPLQLGCAVNTLPLWSPYEWAHHPGVVAVEWTERFVKVFYIPEHEMPADLNSDKPKPDTWDRWMVSYYPFALSNERWPGTCPHPEDVMQPQQLIININFCGDWAGKVWPLSASCVNRVGPQFPLQCRAVDPLLDQWPKDAAEDCCTQFIWDADGKYGTDQYLAERAYFNISWVKVYSPEE